MIELYFDTNIKYLPSPTDDLIPVHLYGKGGKKNSQYARIGGAILEQLERVEEDISTKAMDFLNIALAVTAGDTFVNRDSKAEDAWCREIKLSIPVVNIDKWQIVQTLLEKTLHFLTGDIWKLVFRKSDYKLIKNEKARKRKNFLDHDSVCLFSGGLDSAIGAIELMEKNLKPVLVSHSYNKDQEKQNNVYELLSCNFGLSSSQFQISANPVNIAQRASDDQMRSRSFNFIAFGSIVADILSNSYQNGNLIKLYIPENGLISINPPLTPRRIGALSTRTTHPFFIRNINEIFNIVGLKIELTNPYQYKTKGEMMLKCKNKQALTEIMNFTVSCGKWKRQNKQCGRCLPCLIRRASFNKAKLKDETENGYQAEDLKIVIKDDKHRDDLMSLIMAIRKIKESKNANLWVIKSGFLPIEPTERQQIIDTVLRGFKEVEQYLKKQNLGVNI